MLNIKIQRNVELSFKELEKIIKIDQELQFLEMKKEELQNYKLELVSKIEELQKITLN